LSARDRVPNQRSRDPQIYNSPETRLTFPSRYQQQPTQPTQPGNPSAGLMSDAGFGWPIFRDKRLLALRSRQGQTPAGDLGGIAVRTVSIFRQAGKTTSVRRQQCAT
jgi:hypothetical protein